VSTVLVITPLIIANWSVISAAVMGAVGTLGYTAVAEIAQQALNENRITRAEIDIEESEILEAAAGTDETIVVERDGVRAVFSRDARGALRLCMEGQRYSKSQLKQLGEELIGRVTQQYVYHRVVTELQERNMAIVSEEVSEDRTVKIRVRNW
jgi:hypothetical protein